MEGSHGSTGDMALRVWNNSPKVVGSSNWPKEDIFTTELTRLCSSCFTVSTNLFPTYDPLTLESEFCCIS